MIDLSLASLQPWLTHPVTQAVALAVVGGLIARRVVATLRRAIHASTLDPTVRHLLVLALRPVAYGLLVVAVLERLGVQMNGLLTLVAGASLAMGLGLREILTSLVSGAVLLTTRPFHIDDTVVVGGQEGRVLSFGLVETILRRVDGTTVVLRNDLVLASPILNHDRAGRRRVEVDVQVGWGTDTTALVQILLARTPAVDGVLPEPGVRVDLEALPAGGPVVRVRAWARPSAWLDVRSRLLALAASAVAEVGATRPVA